MCLCVSGSTPGLSRAAVSSAAVSRCERATPGWLRGRPRFLGVGGVGGWVVGGLNTRFVPVRVSGDILYCDGILC